MDAVSAIAILCFNYFIEGDYDSAEVHCQALASLVPTRINSFPSMIWQVVTAVDMYLSGIRVRGPTLPYHLHESFRSLHFYNPNENIVNAASRNLFQIPTGLVFSEDQAHRTKRLLLGLYGVAHSENRSDISCNAAWAHIYDVSYLIAQLQVEVERHGSLEEHIFLVGCQMQFWGMMTDFCYQPDVQRNQLRRLAQAITSIDPKALCDRWSASVGNLDSLLWTLCNAGVTTMYLKGNRSLAFEPLPHWLHPIVAYMIRELELKRPEDLKTLLQRMPFTDRWNDRACRAFPVWSEEEFITPSSTPTSDSQLSSHPEMSKFERLRLNFDYWLEEYPRRDSDR